MSINLRREITMKRALTNFTKLAVAGATVWGVAFYILASAPPTVEKPVGDVKSAEADISWFNVGSDGHEFTRAMAAAGLEPRPYDLNGNLMYFANGKVDKTPAEVEEAIQKILVDHRVNSKSYAGAKTNESLMLAGDFSIKEGAAKFADDAGNAEVSAAMLNGEVVPTSRRNDYVAMTGIDYGKSKDEIMAALQAGEIKSLKDIEPKSYKFFEATYEPDTGMTDLQAVWTAGEFDPKKMNNTAFKQQEPDPNIPACMGCERQVRFQSLAADEPVRANRWNTMMSLDQTYQFYQRAMANRGWKESGVQEKLDRLGNAGVLTGIQGKVLNLEQNGKSMQIILISDGAGGTMVMSQERYSGAERTIPDPNSQK